MTVLNINYFFRSKHNLWKTSEPFDELERAILLLLVIHHECDIQSLYEELLGLNALHSLDIEALQVKLMALDTKGILTYTEPKLYLARNTFFYALQAFVNDAPSEALEALLVVGANQHNSVLDFFRYCLAVRVEGSELTYHHLKGSDYLLMSPLFWDLPIKDTQIKWIVKVLPEFIAKAINEQRPDLLATIFSATVQDKIEKQANHVAYDFNADKWLEAKKEQTSPLFLKPIDSTYQKLRLSVFGAEDPVFSITAILDLLIRKNQDLDQIKAIQKEYNQLISKMDFQYNKSRLLLVEKLLFADPTKLVKYCHDMNFIRDAVANEDKEMPASNLNLLFILIAILPLREDPNLHLFKKNLIDEPYIAYLLSSEPQDALTSLIQRTLFDFLEIKADYVYFIKPPSEADEFIQKLANILKNEQTKKAKSEVDSSNRLVWILDYNLKLVPKIQKIMKNRWSPGLVKSIDELWVDANLCTVPMNDADMAIINKLRSESSTHTYLTLDLMPFVEKLNNVFDTDGYLLKIVEKRNLLVASQFGEVFQLEVYPKIRPTLRSWANLHTQIDEIIPNVFVYDRIDAQTKKILEYIAQAPMMTSNEKNQIIEMIKDRVDYYDEENDIGNVTRIQWDPSLYIWLRVLGNFFHMELSHHDQNQDFSVQNNELNRWIEVKEGHWCKRNLISEERNFERVLQALSVKYTSIHQSKFEFHIDEAAEIIDKLSNLQNVTVNWHKNSFTVKVLKEQDLKIRIDEHDGLFSVTGGASIDGLKFIHLKKLLDANRTGFVGLHKDKIRLVLTKALKERISLLDSVLDADLAVEAKLAYPLQKLIETMDVESDDAWEALSAQWQKPVTIEADLLTPLRDYQKESVIWAIQLLSNGFGVCLADDMGLGKTIQSLKVIEHFAALGPSMVVAPKSVLHNWAEETNRFTKALTPILFDDHPAKTELLTDLQPNQLLIIGYSQISLWSEALAKIDWQTVALDEAQNIKNHNTIRAKALFEFKAKGKLTLSGTPIENNLLELWSQFSFLNPGLLGSLVSFKEKYGAADKNEEDLARLRALVSPFIMRRLKKEVLTELPEKIEINHRVTLNETERTQYEVVRLSALNEAKTNPIELLSALTRLRQICCDAYLVFNSSIEMSSKLQEAIELITEGLIGGHKILIFSQFVSLLDRLGDFLRKEKIEYSLLTGQSSLNQRESEIKRFKSNETNVFLISLKAGGTGLNLTEADMVIHLDPWWNPAAEDQASDRAHRIGQTQVVTIYRLIAEDTIEERIIALHTRKRDLAEKVLSGQDTTQKLNPELLLSLLQQE